MLPLVLPLVFAFSKVEDQFDFWLGDWDLKISTRTDPKKQDWTHSTGRNRIEKILDGKVVQENFVGPGLTGKSWSVFDPKARRWRQTWVDDTGGYIVLEGEFRDGQMTLTTLPQQGQRPKRMVFSKLMPDSFQWDWEVQMLDGEWAATFICEYTRAKKG